MAIVVSRDQCLAGRRLLGWSQAELARQAGVSISTLKDFEAGRRSPYPSSLAAIRKTFEAEGVAFGPGNSAAMATATLSAVAPDEPEQPAEAAAVEDAPTPGDDAPAPPAVADPFPRLLGVPEVMERLGCTRAWLMAHIREYPIWDGRPTYRRIGRSARFLPQDVATLLDSCAPRPKYPRQHRQHVPVSGDPMKLIKQMADKREREKVEAKRKQLSGLPPKQAKAALEKWLDVRKRQREAALAQHAKARSRSRQGG